MDVDCEELAVSDTNSHRSRLASVRDAPGLPFTANEAFKKADLGDLHELYIALANRCWLPDRTLKV